MSVKRRPTVAFTIGMYTTCDGPGHCVYTEAYGLEMTIDSALPVDTIIMSPPHLVSFMTDCADVPSMGVAVGASYVPGDGNLAQVTANKGRWVLARPTDDISRILGANLDVLLCIDDIDELPNVLDQFAGDPERLMIAFQTDSVATPADAKKAAASIRALLAARKLEASRILVNGLFDEENVLDYTSLPNVDGVLVMDAESTEMVRLIEIVANAVAHS